VTGIDPVQIGLVQSLSRPGSNLTGVTLFTAELWAKRLQMLRELAPTADVIASLINPRNPNNSAARVSKAHNAGTNRGQSLLIVRASSEGELDAAFTALAEQRVGALLVDSDSLFGQLRKQIVGLAARHRLPTIYDRREYAEAGGLLSYGTDFVSIYRQAGTYAGRILRGEKTADHPVMEPTKFELIINLKTAKALGLTVPSSLITRADEVIE
jgi:putative ABC transport system substrate-binding protein